MSDWVSETTKYIDKTVNNIRDIAVKPAHRATHYLVYGLMLFFVVAASGLVLAVLIFRSLILAANMLPAPHNNAWIAWVVLGGMFCVLGGVLWAKRGRLS